MTHPGNAQWPSLNVPKSTPPRSNSSAALSIPVVRHPGSDKQVQQVLNNEPASSDENARTVLGVIGAGFLLLGIIVLIVSFNVSPSTNPNISDAQAILDATHKALVMMITGSLSTLIGSIALIALLVVRSFPIKSGETK